MQRLEQQDSYLRHFSGRVAGVVRRDGASWVTLTASAFYPTSGGQPPDTGTLNEVEVTEVIVREGVVWHRMAADVLAVGDEVLGEIDWQRRYRHMQRHSGQHLLSQAFSRIDPSFATHSVSLRGPLCTLDLAGEPGQQALRQAEELVNEVAYQNLAIRCFEVDESRVTRYQLRRPPKVSGRIRLVQIGDWELSACGGTHLHSTAEAAPIKILRGESIRRGLTRVSFRVGLEALEDYRLKHRIGSQLARAFSSQVDELPERIAALRRELVDRKKQIALLEKRVVRQLANELQREAQELPAGKVITSILPTDDAALLKPLAATLCRQQDLIALLAVAHPQRAQLLFACGNAVDHDMNILLQEVLPAVAGRGGGHSSLAQGSGEHPEGVAGALEQARRSLLGS